ncbi:ATP-binding protein [Pseudomonas sp. SDO5522_S412]
MLRIIVLAILLIVSSAIFAEPEKINLTQAEQQWIENHPIVRYTSAASFISDNRSFYINQIALLSGIQFKRIDTNSWSEAKKLVSLGKLDVITAVTINQLDHDFFNTLLKSDNYYLTSTVAVTRKNEVSDVAPLKLDGKTVALVGGKVINDYLRRNYKKITLLTYNNPTLALQALAGKQVDVVIGLTLELEPIIKDHFYGVFEWAGVFPGIPVSYVMGINASSPELASIISKSINSIIAYHAERTFDRLLFESSMTAPSLNSVIRHYSIELITAILATLVVVALAVYSRRAQKAAQKSDADKSAFLAMMSHEIRSPMNGVMSSIELLHTTKLTTQQKDLLTLAMSSASNLLALLDDVLDISKLEAGIITPEYLPTNINKLAHNLVSTYRIAALKHHTSLSLNTSNLTNILIVTSSTRLQQVLSNLLSNAIKFTRHGSITLSIDFDIATPGSGHLKIRVSDTGIGIDKSHQGKLFQAFVQVDSSITRRYGGSGLGLSICKQLVELMGGQIGLDSELGKGTQVSITLPVEFKHKTEAAVTSHLIQPQPKTFPLPVTQLQILVVEDNPVNQRTIDLQLTELGYSALIVENGLEALNVLERKRDKIAIVLLDCHLPDMDGYEVARRMRQQRSLGFTHLPIIAISASTNTEHQKKCMDSGIDDSLPKPLSLPKLRKLIELWAPPPEAARSAASMTARSESLNTLFIRTSLEDIVNLREALETKDLARARYYAHRLHGSALATNTQTIAKAAKKLEDILDNPESTSDGLLNRVDFIEKSLRRIISTD